MSEFRKDPASNRWVISIKEKDFSPRPGKVIPGGLPVHDPSCPFCPGNEGKCGHDIFRAGEDDKWSVRVVPNNKPYLKVEPELNEGADGVFRHMAGVGANEVIIETPVHNIDMDSMDVKSISEVLKSYRARINDLRNDTRMEYILIFKNRGERAGAINYHLHSQLMAMPLVPRLITEEMNTCRAFYDSNRSCVYCEMIKKEREDGSRVILEDNDFIAVTPYASQASFEIWILPKSHESHYHNITDSLADSLSSMLKECIRKINKALNMPAYNYMIHTTPIKLPGNDYYHWHIEIMPRIKAIAGFEWGSGFYINPTPPEEAAEYLRKI